MSNNYGRNEFGPFDLFGTPLAAWLGTGARIVDIINENGLNPENRAKPTGRNDGLVDDYTVVTDDGDDTPNADAAAHDGTFSDMTVPEERDEVEAGRAALADTLGEAKESFKKAMSQLEEQLRLEGGNAVNRMDPGEGLDRFVKKLQNSELRGLADSFRTSAEALYKELAGRRFVGDVPTEDDDDWAEDFDPRDFLDADYGDYADTDYAEESDFEWTAYPPTEAMVDHMKRSWAEVGVEAARLAKQVLFVASDELMNRRNNNDNYTANQENKGGDVDADTGAADTAPEKEEDTE
ncbi:hypothetical protein [Corynebacterium ulceribovis]|uniref:hypothetical protein n=1 Tax=Corynebacterium ulceribovis TaxID=487732 RepID=UPI0003755C64|nr:hypothetical protein [Corynebacterium ulceribovis]